LCVATIRPKAGNYSGVELDGQEKGGEEQDDYEGFLVLSTRGRGGGEENRHPDVFKKG